MSNPSITLKTGSLNSLCSAALRTAGSTSRPTKRPTSAPRGNRATSSSVGAGASSPCDDARDGATVPGRRGASVDAAASGGKDAVTAAVAALGVGVYQ